MEWNLFVLYSLLRAINNHHYNYTYYIVQYLLLDYNIV